MRIFASPEGSGHENALVRGNRRIAVGLPGFENVTWFGLLGPAATPEHFAQAIARDAAKWSKVIKDNNVKAE